MNKETMQLLIKKGLHKRLGSEYELYIQEVPKTNIIRDGLVILKKGDNISPTIYLEPFYDKLENDVPISFVIDEIINFYFQAKKECPPIQMNDFFNDFNKIKDKLFVKIINKHFNKKMLENIPYDCFLDDFAITVHCLVDAHNKFDSFTIHNNLLKMLDVDKDLLISTAIQNTRKLFGLNLRNIKNVIKELQPEEDIDDSPINMWVMTNTPGYWGTTTILFDDVLKDFANNFGNFYVIFSSIHELILIPTIDNSDIHLFSIMNAEINKTEVEPDEVLGNKAYYYDAQKGFVF